MGITLPRILIVLGAVAVATVIFDNVFVGLLLGMLLWVHFDEEPYC